MSKNTNWADAMRTNVSNPGPITKYRQRRSDPLLRKYDRTVAHVTLWVHAVFALFVAAGAAANTGGVDAGSLFLFGSMVFFFSIPFMFITLPIVQLVMRLANKQP